MAFKEYITASILIGVFIVAMLSGGIYLATTNDKNSTLMENEAINTTFSDISNQLGNVQTEANKSKTAFEGETGIITTGFLILESIFGLGITFTKIFISTMNLPLILVEEIIGIPPLVTGAILSILIFLILLLAWRLYKTGT